jgi:hypothetical protein
VFFKKEKEESDPVCTVKTHLKVSVDTKQSTEVRENKTYEIK